MKDLAEKLIKGFEKDLSFHPVYSIIGGTGYCLTSFVLCNNSITFKTISSDIDKAEYSRLITLCLDKQEITKAEYIKEICRCVTLQYMSDFSIGDGGTIIVNYMTIENHNNVWYLIPNNKNYGSILNSTEYDEIYFAVSESIKKRAIEQQMQDYKELSDQI